MQKRELVRAADKLLGLEFILKPFGKQIVPNSDYRAKALDWKLEINKDRGILEITFGKDDKRTKIILPCIVYADDLFKEVKVLKILNGSLPIINNDFIRYVSASISRILSADKSNAAGHFE